MPLNLRRRISEIPIIGDVSTHLPAEKIRILHPGYTSTDIALISVPAFDDGGIDYETIRIACGILTGNRWDGYFSLQRDGNVPINPPSDGILRERRCFFCLPPLSTSASTDSSQPYPVIPRFKDWSFPHGNLPPLWESIRPYLNTVPVPGPCVLTDYRYGVEGAHLVPLSQLKWFTDNRMVGYGYTTSFSAHTINSPTNFLYLRRDIHKLFNERLFCFIPKAIERDQQATASRSLQPGSISETTPEIQHPFMIVGHIFVSMRDEQIMKLWHNREVHDGVRGVSLEFLFARFAWTIFSPSIFNEFLTTRSKSLVLQVWDQDSERFTIEEASPERRDLILKAARSRTETPKKRSRDVDQDENFGEALHEPDSDSELFEFDSWGGGCTFDDSKSPTRGRSRKRRFVECA